MQPLSDGAPSQAMCASHPHVAATLTCPRCGAFGCDACVRYANDGARICEACVPMDQSFVLAERTTRFIANMIDGFVFSLAILPCAAGIVILGESLAVGGTVFLVGLLPLGWFAKVQIRHARSGRSIGKAGQGIRVVRAHGR